MCDEDKISDQYTNINLLSLHSDTPVLFILFIQGKREFF